jgi:hypothetical protein
MENNVRKNVEEWGYICYSLNSGKSISMIKNSINNNLSKLPIWGKIIPASIWPEIAGEIWKIGKKLLQRISDEGIYETLEYESTLAIHNRKGTRATFYKRKKIRYLQDNIIAYQDYGWGDGEILLNYRSSYGKAVDLYRSGYKTYILLSLREVKGRGDVDEFNIRWNIRNGFLTKDGFWATDISNRTRRIKVNIIFPKSRSPQQLSIEESNRKRTQVLNLQAKKELPDGRWRVTWEKKRPKLYEIYVLRWIW